MAIFYYKGFSSSGKETEGHIEANSPQSAQQKLKQQEIYVKELYEDVANRDRDLFPFLSKLIYRIPRKDIGLFVRNLGTLLGAGISLDNALNDVWQQTSNKHLKKVVAQIREFIIQGKSLSEAFGEFSDVFPASYEQMIRVGEASGTYEKTLHSLADLEEKNARLKASAFAAMIYPGIMMVFSIAVVLFLLVTVVPQIKTLFTNFDKALPMPTQIVLFVSDMAQKFWYLIIPFGIGMMWGYNKLRQNEKWRYKTDQMYLHLPIFGELVRKLQVAKFTRNMASLLEANVNLVQALQITTDTTSNVVFKKELEIATAQLIEGDSLQAALKDSVILPNMAKGMLSAGGATDKVGEMMYKVADILENETESSVKKISSTIEPVMLVFMGMIIFFIMISIMLPVYNIAKQIK